MATGFSCLCSLICPGCSWTVYHSILLGRNDLVTPTPSQHMWMWQSTGQLRLNFQIVSSWRTPWYSKFYTKSTENLHFFIRYLVSNLSNICDASKNCRRSPPAGTHRWNRLIWGSWPAQNLTTKTLLLTEWWWWYTGY